MERLITSVRNYPCLWKVDDELYKSNDLKEAAWREVIKECELPNVKEARNLWKKLRDGHRQAITRRKPLASSAWKYEKLMEFLVPTMRNRPKSGNVDRRDDHEEDDHGCNEMQQEDFNPDQRASLSLENEQQTRQTLRSAGRDSLRRKRAFRSSSNALPNNSAMENFFKSMLLTTTELPERLQHKIQRQIFNVVMDVKEEYLAMASSSMASPNNNAHQYTSRLQYQLQSPNHEVAVSLGSTSALSNYSQSCVSSPRQISPKYNVASSSFISGDIEQLQVNTESHSEGNDVVSLKCEQLNDSL